MKRPAFSPGLAEEQTAQGHADRRVLFFPVAHFGLGANPLTGMRDAAETNKADCASNGGRNKDLLGDANVAARGYQKGRHLHFRLRSPSTNRWSANGDTLPGAPVCSL